MKQTEVERVSRFLLDKTGSLMKLQYKDILSMTGGTSMLDLYPELQDHTLPVKSVTSSDEGKTQKIDNLRFVCF